mgnify:FL=1
MNGLLMVQWGVLQDVWEGLDCTPDWRGEHRTVLAWICQRGSWESLLDLSLILGVSLPFNSLSVHFFFPTSSILLIPSSQTISPLNFSFLSPDIEHLISSLHISLHPLFSPHLFPGIAILPEC